MADTTCEMALRAGSAQLSSLHQRGQKMGLARSLEARESPELKPTREH